MDLQIVKTDNGLMVDSRDVSEMVGREHKEILAMIEGQDHGDGRVKHIGFLPTISESGLFNPQDFFVKSSYKVEGNNKTYPCYLLTRKGCDMVANKMTGEKGVLFTATYVTKFEEMEKALQPKLPTTYLEALEALVASEKEKQILLPKAQYFDALVERNLLTNFRDTAKELKIKEQVFIKWLLDQGYVYRDAKLNLKPYAQYVNKLFEIKEWEREKKVGTQTMITPRGRETFRLLISRTKELVGV